MKLISEFKAGVKSGYRSAKSGREEREDYDSNEPRKLSRWESYAIKRLGKRGVSARKKKRKKEQRGSESRVINRKGVVKAFGFNRARVRW